MENKERFYFKYRAGMFETDEDGEQQRLAVSQTTVDDDDQSNFSDIHDRETVPNPKRRLAIWSWGKKVHDDPQCDITVDLVDFRSEFDRRDIRKVDGTSSEIQELMESHPDYIDMMELVVQTVEKHQSIKSVAFVCSWGKHWSVAFAELLRRDYYRKSKVKHSRLIQIENDGDTKAKKKKGSKNKKQRRIKKF